MNKDFYRKLEDWIIENPMLNGELEFTMGASPRTNKTQLNIWSRGVNPLKIICEKIVFELKKEIPVGLSKLDNCGTYHAVDNKGNWHYWNGTSWCSMPNLAEYYKQKGWEQAIEMQYEEGD